MLKFSAVRSELKSKLLQSVQEEAVSDQYCAFLSAYLERFL